MERLGGGFIGFLSIGKQALAKEFGACLTSSDMVLFEGIQFLSTLHIRPKRFILNVLIHNPKTSSSYSWIEFGQLVNARF
jgi:hypothetical protein